MIPPEIFDASEFSVKIAGNVDDFDATDYITPKDQKKMDPFIHYGMERVLMQFVIQELKSRMKTQKHLGVIVGSGIGGVGSIEKNSKAFLNGGPRKISPFFVPSTIVNMVAGNFIYHAWLKRS